MKLIEFRFKNPSPTMCYEIAQRIRRFFEVNQDIDLSMLFVESISSERANRLDVKVEDVLEVLRQSIETSSSEFIDYGKMASIKSNATCRFVVVELDAVVRICMGHSDVAPDFFDMNPEILDISSLLIETDLFDYI